MNLTLSIDDNLLREARKMAVEIDTTVNSLVREYLREFKLGRCAVFGGFK